MERLVLIPPSHLSIGVWTAHFFPSKVHWTKLRELYATQLFPTAFLLANHLPLI